MANKLIHETSPYLLQHKNNPVNWFAWNNESLKLAKKLNKPILLSVGYSSCHWCHVMAHESFEDEKVAQIMNENFINIKIDREERPDLDSYYQLSLNLMGQQGGWPLTMFLDIDTSPFWGGTYFPKNPRYGLPGFVDILQSVFKTFSSNKITIKNNAALLKKGIERALLSSGAINYSNEALNDLFLKLQKNMDFNSGGLLGSMKFPQAPLLKTYLAGQKTYNLKKNIHKTMLFQCMGGIYDHVGGGISRYTVDDFWLVPHFEKMLYDNANFVEMLAVTNEADEYDWYFKNKIDHTISWLEEEMLYDKEKGISFYSAMDADSEGVEGKYYVWTFDELKRILKKDFNFFLKEYGVSENGNWERKNILNRLRFVNDYNFNDEFSIKNKKILNQIKLQRKNRVPPGIDVKILADWNLSFCSALIRAYRTFEDKKYLELSKKILLFFESKIESLGEFFHSYCNSKRGHSAFLSDYANLIKVYLSLYMVEFDNRFLKKAMSFTDDVIDKFYMPKEGVFYYASTNEENINNTANTFDTATQSGSGIMLENLIQLYNFTKIDKYLKISDDCIKNNWSKVFENPISLSSFLHSANLMINSHHIILIKKEGGGLDIEKYIRKNLIFNTFEIVNSNKELPTNSPAKNKTIVNGLSTVYICSKSSCYEPINDINKVIQKLDELPFL